MEESTRDRAGPRGSWQRGSWLSGNCPSGIWPSARQEPSGELVDAKLPSASHARASVAPSVSIVESRRAELEPRGSIRSCTVASPEWAARGAAPESGGNVPRARAMDSGEAAARGAAEARPEGQQPPADAAADAVSAGRVEVEVAVAAVAAVGAPRFFFRTSRSCTVREAAGIDVTCVPSSVMACIVRL